MNKRLVKDLTKEEKEEFESILRHNHVIRAIKKLLEEDTASCQRDRRSFKSLLTQNYAEFQADRNATERTYLKVLDLLTV